MYKTYLENQYKNSYRPYKPILLISGHVYDVENRRDPHEASKLNSAINYPYMKSEIARFTYCLQRLDAFSVVLSVHPKEEYWQIVGG